MLDHLQRRASNILATAESATLSTAGPAGIQARLFPCQAVGTDLFLLLPGTSDHLLNLEENPQAVATTSGWQLRGSAQILPLQQGPADLLLPQLPQAAGCVLVRIRPRQLQVHRQNGWGFSETIDLDPDAQT